MKKIFLALLIMALIIKSFSQNFIPNPSFEKHKNPILSTSLTEANYWFIQETNVNNPYYFNKYTTPPLWNGVPFNVWGYQYARFGNAYAGIGSLLFYFTHVRQYISVRLKDSLIQNHTYILSYYVSLADNVGYATNHYPQNILDLILFPVCTILYFFFKT